jgi:type I restriction enzyme, S subunit
MRNLSNTALGDLAISVPPLPEQRRIVCILEETFEGIATAKVNVEKNLQNARTLFVSAGAKIPH